MLIRSEPYSPLDDAAGAVLIGRDRRSDARNEAGLLDLRGLWLILRWRARLIAFITLATVAAAACALVVLPPKYNATTVVLVDPRQPQVTNAQAVLSGIGADAAAVESQVELIESTVLASKVIGSLKLDQDPEFTAPSLVERISEKALTLLGRVPDVNEGTKATRLIDKFRKGLAVHRRGLTYVLEIGYLAKDPAKAAQISNAVAEAYLDDQRAAKGEITARISGWLGDRIEEMRDRVRSSEAAVAAYRSANNLVDVTQGNRLISRQIEDLTQQLAHSRSRTADARARLEQVQQAAKSKGDPASLNEALQSLLIANLRLQYAAAARVEAENSAIYGNKYPGLIAVRAQLADLRRLIDNEIARILVGVRNDYQTAVSSEASLEVELSRLKQQSGTLSQADVKLHELEREAQANRTLFEQFLGRVKETAEQQSLQIADARIISPALPPLKPDRPGVPLLIAVAACGGIILGVGTVLVREQTRQGFRNVREVAQFLSVPSIGMLPVQEPAAASRTAASRFAQDHPNSPYARNLRAIRARLLRSSRKPRGEILVVVSALPGEGKSTFACNFALAAEASGVRTLLIDGDVYTDTKSGLHLLGTRDPSINGDDAKDIDPTRLKSFLQEYGGHFDLVVIDAPAILPFGGSTPHIEFADRAVLLVEWDRTGLRAVADAFDRLDVHANKLAGVVLNKVPVRWCRLFDYGDYQYSAADMKKAA